MRTLATLLIGTCLPLSSVLHAQATGVKTQTRTLLDAYAREDQKTVLASIDDQTVMYGSDATEVFHGVASIQAMRACGPAQPTSARCRTSRSSSRAISNPSSFKPPSP
jgi:uncharacterized SAM-dependent methyltransferase